MHGTDDPLGSYEMFHLFYNQTALFPNDSRSTHSNELLSYPAPNWPVRVFNLACLVFAAL